MKPLFLLGLAAALLLPELANAQNNFTNPPGQVYSYTNSGSGFQPQINAVNFVNYGTFQVGTLLPFETYDTLNFLNYGTMIGATGWRFDHTSSSSGTRSMASSFVNFNPGTVEAYDVDGLGTSPIGADCTVCRAYPSYLLVSATNITTGGGTHSYGYPADTTGASLIVGANGLLQLNGVNADLSYSGLEVLPVWDEAMGNIYPDPPDTPTSLPVFVPDIAVYDRYWVQDSFSETYPLGIDGLWDGTVFAAQGVPRPPTDPSAQPGFSFQPTLADSYIAVLRSAQVIITNEVGDRLSVNLNSNTVKGAVFVYAPPGFTVSDGFAPGGQPRNAAETIGVSITTTILNSVTGQQEPASIRIVDTLASDTRIRGLSVNQIGCGSATSRPQNYTVDRSPYGIGVPNNRPPEPDFFQSAGNDRTTDAQTNILEDVITNHVAIVGDYAGYGAFFDNLASRPQAVEGNDPSNYPGRVEINADTVDLTRTRIRGEGRIYINTPRLISSSNSVIDCEKLSLNVGSGSGDLKVESIVPPGSVARFRGSISAWSAYWSNTVRVVVDNYTETNYVTTNTDGTSQTNSEYIETPLTNYFGVTYHTLMLNAAGLQTTVPAYVYDFASRSRSATLDDDMTVVQSLYFTGDTLTINGSLTALGAYPVNPITGRVPPMNPLSRWVSTNAPNLLYFTNNGFVSIPDVAHFGDDRLPYTDFINNGSISAASIGIGSDYFENSGQLNAQLSVLQVRAGTGKLQNGSSISTGISQFTCGNLKFDHYNMTVGGQLVIAATNSLSDAGPASANNFSVDDGFALQVKPRLGDLLGTTLRSTAPVDTPLRINHSWAAADLGPTSAGFRNNAAVGTLVLSAPNTNSLFVFSGTGTRNGLYVDLLDLSALPDYARQLQINPNLTIYFAAAKLGFTPPNNTNNTAQEPEEYLDGRLNGRLRWVQSFAGPNSSQSVVVDGKPMQVNKALLNSKIIDSDGDGLPNYYDIKDSNGPFNGATIHIQINGNGTVTPLNDGEQLVVGLPYAVVAQPGDGSVFLGWTDPNGATISDSPDLSFVMPAGGTNVTANFSFVSPPGTFVGLFSEPAPYGIEYQRSGDFTLTTTKGGRYSGFVRLGSKRYRFTGDLGQDGSGLAYPRNSSLAVQFQVGSNFVTGTVSSDTNWTAELLADRSDFNARQNPAPQTNRYTMVFFGTQNSSDTNGPQGDGYGFVTVNASGRVHLSATLADGTRVTQAGRVTESGLWPLYVPLPRHQGQIMGWLNFVNKPQQDISGQYDWIKLPNARNKFYPDGFNFQADTVATAYDSKLSPVTGFNDGILSLLGGNLSDAIFEHMSVDDHNRVVLDTRKSRMTLNRSRGLFRGSVINPATGKPVKFSGIILQKQSVGYGYFLGTSQSGEVFVGP